MTRARSQSVALLARDYFSTSETSSFWKHFALTAPTAAETPHRPQMAPQTVYFDRLSVNPGLIPARGRKSVAERGVDFREPAARNRSSHFWFEKWRGSSHRCVRVTRVGERALFAYAGLESGASARQPVECLLSANTGFVFHEKSGKQPFLELFLRNLAVSSSFIALTKTL